MKWHRVVALGLGLVMAGAFGFWIGWELVPTYGGVFTSIVSGGHSEFVPNPHGNLPAALVGATVAVLTAAALYAVVVRRARHRRTGNRPGSR